MTYSFLSMSYPVSKVTALSYVGSATTSRACSAEQSPCTGEEQWKQGWTCGFLEGVAADMAFGVVVVGKPE